MICFQGGNSYEDELLQQIRKELKQDDEIEEMLQDLDKPSKASKSKRPTSKLGNKYIDAAKQIPYTIPVCEPPSKFLALASSLASAHFLVCHYYN